MEEQRCSDLPTNRKWGSPMERGIIGRRCQATDVYMWGEEEARSAFISHWFTLSQSPPNISFVLHLLSSIRWGHEPLPMARMTAWWPPQSNEIERGGKWETGQSGRRWRWRRKRKEYRIKSGVMEEKREGRHEGGWRFLNVPLWSMKRRKSNGQKHLRNG